MHDISYIKILLTSFVVAMTLWHPPGATKEKSNRGHLTHATVLLDLSGGQSSIGRPAMNGFLLALQDVEVTQDPLLSAVMLNTASDPKTTLRVAQVVVPSVKVAVGFTDNDSMLNDGPVFQKAKVPFLSIGATDPTLPKSVGNFVFLTAFGDNTQAAAGAEFAYSEFGTNVAVLWDSTSQYTRTLPIYFRTRFEEMGGSVLLNESFDGGCNISSLGEQVWNLSPQPDFIYLAGLPDCVGEVIASLRSVGLTIPIIGGDGLDTQNLLRGPFEMTDNVYYTSHAWLSAETGTPQAKQFIEAYQKAYGSPPEDSFAALGYDAGKILLDALERSKSTKPRRIQKALEKTQDFQGVTGTIGFSKKSHVPLKTVWTIKVTQGELSLATEFVPEKVPEPTAVLFD